MDSTLIPTCGGIYKILCVPTGKFYIGSAKDLRKRCNSHFGELRRNTHHNPKLQAAFNKYGEDVFIHDILELVLIPEMLIIREQTWLDKLMPFGENGFNIDRFAGSTRLGYTFSPESRARMSVSHLGQVSHRRGKKASAETRAKQSAARLGKPSTRKNYKHSPATLEKISIARKGKSIPHPKGMKHTPEAKAKIAAASRERHHKPESIEKLRVAKLGNKHGAKDYIVTSPEGVEYEVHDLTAFCRERDLTPQCLGLVATGKRKHHKGWKARYPA